jgi:hypothetical protein
MRRLHAPPPALGELERPQEAQARARTRRR